MPEKTLPSINDLNSEHQESLPSIADLNGESVKKKDSTSLSDGLTPSESEAPSTEFKYSFDNEQKKLQNNLPEVKPTQYGEEKIHPAITYKENIGQIKNHLKNTILNTPDLKTKSSQDVYTNKLEVYGYPKADIDQVKDYAQKVATTAPLYNDFKNKLQQNPNDRDAAYGLGSIELSNGDYNAAQNYFAKALTLQQQQAQQPNQANPYPQKVASSDSNILTGLAYVKQKMGANDEANSFYEDAIKADPTNAYAIKGLASLAYKKGDHAAAQELLAHAKQVAAPKEALEKSAGEYYYEKEHENDERDKLKAIHDGLEDMIVKGKGPLGWINPFAYAARSVYETASSGMDDFTRYDQVLKDEGAGAANAVALGGLSKIGLSALMALNPEATVGFTTATGVAENVLPDDLIKAAMTPVSALLDYSNIHPQEGGKAIASMGDVIAQGLLFHKFSETMEPKAKELAEKVKENKEMTLADVATLQGLLHEIKPEEITRVAEKINEPAEIKDSKHEELVKKAEDLQKAHDVLPEGEAKSAISSQLQETDKAIQDRKTDIVNEHIERAHNASKSAELNDQLDKLRSDLEVVKKESPASTGLVQSLIKAKQEEIAKIEIPKPENTLTEITPPKRIVPGMAKGEYIPPFYSFDTPQDIASLKKGDSVIVERNGRYYRGKLDIDAIQSSLANKHKEGVTVIPRILIDGKYFKQNEVFPIENIDFENKLKTEKNAIQEQVTDEMDVQSEAGNDEGVGEGNAEHQNTSKQSEQIKPKEELRKKGDKEIEDKFRRDLEDNYDSYKEKYKAKYGNVFNTDNARIFSEDYKNSPETMSGATQLPARDFVNKMYQEELNKPAPEDKEDMVLFTAGGSGAGKSRALEHIESNPQVIVDTNFANFNRAVKDVDEALEAGKQVHIEYVYRDPIQAFLNGVVPRMKRPDIESGGRRGVPYEISTSIHEKSLKTIQLLAEHYKDNPNVQIKFSDNRYEKGKPHDLLLSDVKKITLDKEFINKTIKDELDRQYKAGELTDIQYKGLAEGKERSTNEERNDIRGILERDSQSNAEVASQSDTRGKIENGSGELTEDQYSGLKEREKVRGIHVRGEAQDEQRRTSSTEVGNDAEESKRSKVPEDKQVNEPSSEPETGNKIPNKNTAPPSEKEVEPPKKLRALEQRIEDRELPKEFKDGLKEKGWGYTPESVEVNAAQAKEIVDFYESEGKIDDLAKKIMLDSENKIPKSSKAAIAPAIMERYMKEADSAREAGDFEKHKEFINKMTDLASWNAKEFTQAGQFTSIGGKLWKKLLSKYPETVIAELKNKLKAERDVALKGKEKEILGYKDFIEEFLKSDDFDKIVSEKVKSEVSKLAERSPKKESIFTSKEFRKKREQELKDKWKTAGKSSASSSIVGLNVEQIEILGEMGAIKLIDGAVKFAEWAKKMAKEFEGVTNDQLDYVWRNSRLPVEFDEKQRSLKEFANVGRFEKMSPEEKKVFLDKMSERIKGMSDEKKQAFLGDIIDEINKVGGLSDDRFKELYAKAMGMPHLTEEAQNHIYDLSKKINELDKAADNYNKLYEAGASVKELKEAGKLFDKASQDARYANDKVSDYFRKEKSLGDVISSAIQGNLMTTITALTNIIGNVSKAFPIAPAIRGVSSGMDFILSKAAKLPGLKKLFSEQRTIDAAAYWKGTIPAIPDAIKRAAKEVIKGSTNEDATIRDTHSKVTPGEAWKSIFDQLKRKKEKKTYQLAKDIIEGTGGASAEAMFRVLNFGDKVFTIPAEQGFKSEMAALLKLKGADREKFMKMTPEKFQEVIEGRSQEYTFQNESAIAKKALELKKKLFTPPEDSPQIVKDIAKIMGALTIPFVKTPVNVMSYLVKLSIPEVALAKGVYEGMKGNRRESLEALSTALVGWQIRNAIQAAVKNNLITPVISDDDTKAEKAFKMGGADIKPGYINLTGFRRMISGGDTHPQSGDNWVSYKYFGLLGIPMALNAKIKNDYVDEQTKSYSNELYDSFAQLPKTVLEQTFLSGLNTTLDAIASPSKFQQWGTNTTVALSTTLWPNTIAQLSKFSQSDLKDVRVDQGSQWEKFKGSLKNTFKDRMFMGSDLPSRVSLWGQKISRLPEGVDPDKKYMYALLDMYKPDQVNPNSFEYRLYKAYDELSEDKRNKLLPSLPMRGKITVKGKRIPIDEKQYQQLSIYVGQARKYYAEEYILSDDFESDSESDKFKKLKAIYSKGYSEGKIAFIDDNPSIEEVESGE